MATPSRVVMYTRAHPGWKAAAEFRWSPEEGIVLNVFDSAEGRTAQAYYDRGILSLPERRLVGVDEPEAFMRTLIDTSWHPRVALVDESGSGSEIMGRAASRAGGERVTVTRETGSAHPVPDDERRGADDGGVIGLLPAGSPMGVGGSHRRSPGPLFAEASANQVPGREPTGGRPRGGVGFGLGAMRDHGFGWCCPVCHYRAVAKEAAEERRAARRRHPSDPLRANTGHESDGGPLDRPEIRAADPAGDQTGAETGADGLLLVGPWTGWADR